MNLSPQVSIFDSSTSGVLRWSTHTHAPRTPPRPPPPLAPAPPPPPPRPRSSLQSRGHPVQARVFVSVWSSCIPDVYLTASHQSSHGHNNISSSPPMCGITCLKSSDDDVIVLSTCPSLRCPRASPLFLGAALTLEEECIVFANRNQPDVMTRHAGRAGNLKMRQSARTPLWCWCWEGGAVA